MKPTRDADIGERLLAHVERGTTDLAEGVLRVPVESYLDPERFEREIRNVWKRLPLMLAFTGELSEPSAYKAMEVLGLPVLLLRGGDGEVRAFLGVCSHRGARLKTSGTGRCRRIVCPYHAWTYDDRGALVGIYQDASFGAVDRAGKGLTRLPCEERAGLVFVVLTPGASIDIAGYLGGMLPDLETLGIAGWKVYARRELRSANWKATFDGYVDGYHLEVLHPKTVGRVSKGAANTFEAFGPHQRIGFANQDIERLRGRPREDWGQDEGFGFVRTLFPGTSLAVREGAGGLVSQLLPGPAPDESLTLQTFLRARLPESDEERRRADLEVELLHAAVRDEDYVTVAGCQRGMASGAIREVTFGRNELGNQRLHRWIEYYAREDPREEDRPRI